MKRTGISETNRVRRNAFLSGAALLFALGLGACGQRGPLYLPDSPNAAEETVEPASTSDNTEKDDKDNEETA
jgi:predicted small lipoprotein YifL